MLGHLMSGDFIKSLEQAHPRLYTMLMELQADKPEQARSMLVAWEADFLEVCTVDLDLLKLRWKNTNWFRSFSFDGLGDIERGLVSTLTGFCEVWLAELDG